MDYYCKKCGAAMSDNSNYCPNCGTLLVVNADTGYSRSGNNTGNYGNSNANYYNNSGNYSNSGNYNSAGSYSNTAGSDKDNSGILKTAAIAGGTALGVSALTGLARNLTHRRRPPYMGGGRPPMGGMGGPGGPGGMGGPGGPGGRF